MNEDDKREGDQREDEAIAVLMCPMDTNDAHASCVGEYLMTLLKMVWREDEGFSGKRPFGNSGWKGEVFGAMANAGLVASDDTSRAEHMVSEAIGFMSDELAAELEYVGSAYNERLAAHQLEHGKTR